MNKITDLNNLMESKSFDKKNTFYVSRALPRNYYLRTCFYRQIHIVEPYSRAVLSNAVKSCSQKHIEFIY